MKRGTKQEKLEKQKRTFFLIGLIIALGLSLAAFEWKTFDYSLSDLVKVDFAWVDEEFVEPTQHKKPNVPLPMVKPVVSIKEVDNEAMVDEDIEFFDPESGEDVEVPEFIYTPPDEPEEGQSMDFVRVPHEMPVFPGGEAALMEYLGSKIHFTQQALDIGRSGRVFIEFVVEKDGSVSNVKLLRGIGYGLDEIAMDAVRGMPKWKPGKQRGIAVRVPLVVPIIFKLK